jgi:hypothetical protein
MDFSQRYAAQSLENPEMLSSQSGLSFAHCPNEPDLISADINTIMLRLIQGELTRNS